jgi:hypothetical protein
MKNRSIVGVARRGFVGIVLLVMMPLDGCRSKSDAMPPRETNAAPAGATSGSDPKAQTREGADERLFKGTLQDLVMSGSLVGAIKEGGRGKRVPPGCVNLGTSFAVRLQGPLENKELYGLEILLSYNYQGPKAYAVSTSPGAAPGPQVTFSHGEQSMPLIAVAGTVSVNPDERSGSLDVDLKGTFGNSERIHLKGVWRCPPPLAE